MPRTKNAESSHPPLVAKVSAPPPDPAIKQQTAPSQPGRARYRVQAAAALPIEEMRSGVMAASPVFNAAGVMQPLQKNLAGSDTTSDSLMLAVDEQVERVQAGDLVDIEAMLVSQAISLQTVYSSLTRRALVQESLGHYQTYMTLALKAQAQSRSTLQALVELKQPRHAPTFIKQANLANGPQQVNNGQPAVQTLPPAEENPILRIKLLEADTTPTVEYVNKGVNEYERLEQRAARAAG